MSNQKKMTKKINKQEKQAINVLKKVSLFEFLIWADTQNEERKNQLLQMFEDYFKDIKNKKS